MKYLMRTFSEEHFAVVDPFPARSSFSAKYSLELNADVRQVAVVVVVVEMTTLANGQ